MPGRGTLWTMIKGAKGAEWIALAIVISVIALIAIRSQPGAAPSSETALEQRVAAVLATVDGAGRVRVLIGEGEEAGVIVVADGASDLRVKLAIERAVSTLLGVDINRVDVLKRDEGG